MRGFKQFRYYGSFFKELSVFLKDSSSIQVFTANNTCFVIHLHTSKNVMNQVKMQGLHVSKKLHANAVSLPF